MTGYGAAAQWYFEAGWWPLPLPHGKKKSPPDGTTGYDGRPISYADVMEWVAEQPNGNIGLRLPENVVGIDIDAYKAECIATMRELTARLGALPPTWRSTSRGLSGSGIYFFAIPDDLSARFGDVGPGVETIRHAHRYAVVSPSLHPEGGTYAWYKGDQVCQPPKVGELPALPDAWVGHLMAQGDARKVHREDTPHDAYDALPPAEKARVDRYMEKTLYGIKGDLRASAGWKVGETDGKGRGWEKLQADKALRLAALGAADWNPYTMKQAWNDFLAWAPTGGGWTEKDVKEKFTAQARRADPAPFPVAQVSMSLDEMAPGAAGPPAPAPRQPADGTGKAVTISGYREQLDTSNAGKMVGWLRENVGTGPLSGIFSRGVDLVFTPQIGHEGYVEPRLGEAEGSASITVLNKDGLVARITNRYECVKMVETKKATEDTPAIWEARPAIFPGTSAQVAISAVDDLVAVRPLGTVTHAPTFRPDGSLISTPGYDEATQTLFLPVGKQPPPVGERPSADDVAKARGWIDYMLTDFRFVTQNDRANYIGLMLSPLLRAMTPPPYKLGVIEAHQPGSGKTFLARSLISLHGGLMHAEIPGEEAELVKTITSVLDTSTGAVVVFDNVTGMVKSPALTGLLTSPTFEGRRLGTGTLVQTVNDRLWVITGNNAALGGDLTRRSLRIRIDPGVPNPERRTQFTIADFETWTREHRGDLLWSLLVLVRHWVASGSPMPAEIRQDSYGTWSAVVGSILAAAGIPGVFDDEDTTTQSRDVDFEEWSAFFETLYSVVGNGAWTTKTILDQVQPLGWDGMEQRPIPYDALPGGLLEGRHGNATAPALLGRSLGRWLANREGRWFGDLTVRRASIAHKQQMWRLERFEPPS